METTINRNTCRYIEEETLTKLVSGKVFSMGFFPPSYHRLYVKDRGGF